MTNTANEGEELLKRVAEGEESAFRLLFYRWHPILSAHIFRITESWEITEEIVHDVFLKIWQTRETLFDVKNFRAYLMAISKNHALNALMKISREQIYLQQYQKDLPSLQIAEQAPDPYTLIDEAIDQLSPRQKEVYLLTRHKRLSYQQTASALGIGRETVKTHLENAVKNIRIFVSSRLSFLITLAF